MNDGILENWKEKTKGLFHLVEYTRFWNYITDLQHTEDLYNQLLKDYDELQQENEELKKNQRYHNKETLRDMVDELQERIEKAVEYIEKEKSCYMRSCDISNATNREGLIISSAVRTCDDTLKILRGNNDK